MRANIFIPQEIKVGFQERNDTYTKKLAYIIYYDEKGKLRKEKSWNNWRNHSIEPKKFINEPIEGFVLNKKAGGYSTGWNYRQTYVRVYDPRGFEFEISVPNLLYILENTNSIKGKGLEGEFVYGWDKADLVLIPVSSPDYKNIMEYNNKVFNQRKFKTSDMIPGAIYLTKDNEKLVYIGRFDKYNWDGKKFKNKQFFFYKETKFGFSGFISFGTLDKIIDVVQREPVENYAELREKLEYRSDFSPLDPEKDEYYYYTLHQLKDCFNKLTNIYCFDSNYQHIRISKNPTNNKYEVYYSKDILSPTYKFESLEELHEQLKPMFRFRYLKNGKLYQKDGVYYDE